MQSIYPELVGISLSPTILDTASINKLVKSMPKHCIIHVYGLSFTGTSEVSHILAKCIEGHVVDEDLIVRAIAYHITQKKEWYDKHLFQPYFDVLSFAKESKKMQVIIENVHIPHLLLTTKKVSILAQKLMSDEKFIESLCRYISMAIRELEKHRVIVANYTALPHYLEQTSDPEANKVIHFLLTVHEDVARERYYQYRLQEYAAMDTDFEPNSDVYDLIEQDYAKLIQEKNALIVDRAINSGEGIIVDPGYKIDTSYCMVDTVVGTVLSELYQIYC